MGIWGRRGPVPDGVIDDRCWSDPDLDSVIDRLEARSGPAGPEHISTAVDHLATVAHDPDRLDLAVRGIGQRLSRDLPALRRAAEEPRTDAELADILALLGQALRWAAWDARGGGWAETVGTDQGYTFRALLEEADEVLQAGLDLAPGHAAMAHCRIWTAIGLGGLSEDAWWERFAVVQAVSPSFFAGHMSMLQALSQKWHGSHEVMFDFAQQVARTAPIGSPAGAVLAMAHCEYRLLAPISEFSLLERDEELVMDASRRWAAGGHQALAHPCAPEAHQIFGWYCGNLFTRAGDERAAFHYAHATARIAPWFWSYGSPNAHKTYLKQLKRYRVSL